MFNQTFEPHDLLVIFLLMVLEGLLSMDNALVLGLLARRLPEEMRSRALTYGLIGALVFRVIAIGTASTLMRWHFAELVGGAFLLYVSIKHLWKDHRKPKPVGPAVDREGRPIFKDEATGIAFTEDQLGEEMAEQTHGQIRNRDQDYSSVHTTRERGFWMTVASIEFTDIVFAVDSILAAIALVGSAPAGTPSNQFHPKLWVVLIGGMGGVILMRFAAIVFIRLLEKFPRFEISAYLLVLIIGAKMVANYLLNLKHDWPTVDFNNFTQPACWIFWGTMAAAFGFGFLPGGKTKDRAAAVRH